MPILRFWSRVRAGWRAFRSQNGEANAPPFLDMGQFQREEQPFPPGLKPVIIKTDEATFDDIPGVRFRRSETRLRGEGDAQYRLNQVHRVRLPGCNCFVAGPNEVAYLSDISGLPVCRRCATVCICQHKVAPRERVMIGRRAFICKVCHEQQQRQLRREKLKQFLLGPFVVKEIGHDKQ